jgi:hypothetical protein
MTLDPIPYLKSIRSSTASMEKQRQISAPGESSTCDEILDLSIADMAAARLTRSLRARHPQARRSDIDASGGSCHIPAGDVVAIGGRDLRPRTPEQPFPDEAELANDNLGRFVVLLVLLLAVAGGYLYTVFGPDDRRAIEVTPPESPAIRIVSLERGDA